MHLPSEYMFGHTPAFAENFHINCSWRETVIGDHTKIDNLVQVLFHSSGDCAFLPFHMDWQILLQIGHNVVIGKCCMICGQVGIAGSVTYVFISIMPSLAVLGGSYNFTMLFYRFIVLWAYRLGDYVTLGGRVAIRDHVSIASKVLFLQLCLWPCFSLWLKKTILNPMQYYILHYIFIRALLNLKVL